MPANDQDNNYRRNLLSITQSRGITMAKKRADDLELERLANRKSRLQKTEPFTMTRFDNYFENLKRMGR